MREVIFYLSSIIIANLLVIWFGIIKIGFLSFPAGTIAIGLTFSARDFVQRKYGKWKCWIWMLVASLITTVFSWDVAFASFTSFMISESIDWLIFTILPNQPFRKRIYISNCFSTPIDSLVFVWMVFGLMWQPIIGQTVIKFLSSLIILPFIRKRN